MQLSFFLFLFFNLIGPIWAMRLEISPNTPFYRVQKYLESPLLLQILPETSSIWAFLALLYRGEVAVAVLLV
jgi:hypothetical protein